MDLADLMFFRQLVDLLIGTEVFFVFLKEDLYAVNTVFAELLVEDVHKSTGRFLSAEMLH